ncbi:cysteine desulfurase-like protein [uncultured Sphingomonas sp.]|uniref:cysteine desulfurase-like protein n=1 Tax=uncultured Sphingomonas sp. TaxID=158754 RepID=UPI0035CA7AA5
MTFPIDAVRRRFPALDVTDDDRARIYLDAPGGTQVCSDAIDAMRRHLALGAANAGGVFATSCAVDSLSRSAHQAIADLIGADPDEVAFGANMTSLTFAVSRALARDWRSGDELVVTRLDHDANVAPWLEVAEDRGLIVRWLDFDPATGRLQLDSLPGLVSDRTRLVAIGGASNALGSIADLDTIVRTVRRESQALVYVDAVQLAPHVALDVKALGCDLLAFSPYKLFGPHVGVLWCRREVADRLRAYKVRAASSRGMARFETGTPSFEAQAGIIGMADYLEWLGEMVSPGLANRRERLSAAFEACETYEAELGSALLEGLAKFNSVRVYGPADMTDRVPTFAFTVEGHSPSDVVRHLADRGIFAWAGHFYAVETIVRLRLEAEGGLVRVGLCHYNTMAEVDLLIAALADLLG